MDHNCFKIVIYFYGLLLQSNCKSHFQLSTSFVHSCFSQNSFHLTNCIKLIVNYFKLHESDMLISFTTMGNGRNGLLQKIMNFTIKVILIDFYK